MNKRIACGLGTRLLMVLGGSALTVATPALAQESERCLCVGVHVGTINMDDVGYGVFGVGGRVTGDLHPNIAVEIEINRYSDNPDGYGGDTFILAGSLVKYPFGRNALFVKVRPGIAWFRSHFVTARNPSLGTKPALDLGIGFSRIIGDRLTFRADLGETIIFFGDDLVFHGTLEPHQPGMSYNPALTIGFLLHLFP